MNKRGDTSFIDISDVTEFSWERLYIFGPYAHRAYIRSIIGFDWPLADSTFTWSSDSYSLLLFVSGQKVVKYFDVPRNPDFSDVANEVGYSREEDNFIIDESGNVTRMNQTK